MFNSSLSFEAMSLSDTDWSFAHIEEALYEEFTEISSKARVEEFKKMNKTLEKQMGSELAEPITVELNRPQKDMWHKIIEAYQSTVSDGQELLAKKAKSMYKCFFFHAQKCLFLSLGFDSSEKEIEKSIVDLKRRAWVILCKRVNEELADNLLLLKLRNR
jgi:hypothetical protein